MSLALDALLARLRKQRFAVTDAPRAGRVRKPGTRYVPADDKRAVWKRDGERCAFVADSGNRCTETRFLELHHVEPHGRGGVPEAGNLQLMCRVHNAYRAEQDFGAAHMERVKANIARTRAAGHPTFDSPPSPAPVAAAEARPLAVAVAVATPPLPALSAPVVALPPVPAPVIRDAIAALRTLGFSTSTARAATTAAAAKLTHAASIEQLIRDSLRLAPTLASRGATSAREPVALYEYKPRGSHQPRLDTVAGSAQQQYSGRTTLLRRARTAAPAR